MKLRYSNDLQHIERLFALKDEIQVPQRLFNEILNTYDVALHEKFRKNGIELREGKFIIPCKYL